MTNSNNSEQRRISESPNTASESRAPRNGQGNRIWNFAMLGVSMSRPGEGRDPYGADSRFGTGAKAFFPLLMPGIMDPGLLRDDPLRARTRSRPHQRTAQFSHMR
jgi:hypothetical protein